MSKLSPVTDALGGMAFGGDYNPEQWDREVWPQDIALMCEAGVNLVTVGVFSWGMLETAPGVFDFSWLDDVLGLLHQAGIKVDLATATASPPPWFTTANPQARLVDAQGVVRSHGARQAYCPSSSEYRAAAANLAGLLADRYADHPAVVMWHINNEYGCHNHECFCPASVAAFRSFLRARYGTLDELNRCWGTAFWSQRYGDWDQVLPPAAVSYHSFANPTQQLDWARFCSVELLECFRAEANAVRARASQPITTNFMSFFKHVDYFAWTGEMDVVSNDDYLRWANLDPQHLTAMSADLMRSLAGGKPWMLMEHSTSAVNWQPRNPAKAPGMMRRNSLQHLARGADAALFFQWRASRAGAEKFHSGLVPHSGTETARWREVVQLGATVRRLAPLAGSTVVPADVAIAFDWTSWWGAELDSHPTTDLSVVDRVQSWHRQLWTRNVGVDFVHPHGDLSAYRVVLLPALYLIDDAAAAALAAFVRGGGVLLAGYFTGIVDENDHIRLGGYPGALRDILGVTVEEFAPLLPGQQVELSDFGPATTWTETARADTAFTLATYTSGDCAGSVAFSRNAVDAGSAFYLGTEIEPDQLCRVIDLVLGAGKVTVGPALPGVELVSRENGTTRWTFAINHTDAPVSVPLTGRDLISGAQGSDLSVEAGGVAVIEHS